MPLMDLLTVGFKIGPNLKIDFLSDDLQDLVRKWGHINVN